MANFSSFDEVSAFDIEKLRKDVASGKRPLRITSHAQIEAFKDGLLLKHLGYTAHGHNLNFLWDTDFTDKDR